MGHKKRAVKDKYYQLAKEQGYRARSSFKLVQLNRKYDLLSKATRVIDLCAAPGGWLQVCAKNMVRTPETQIIGVDLHAIKPIRGCVTFQADITTQLCRQLIKKEMGANKADLVLCDGAPNVGAEYSKDAFVQNELTVHALRFACEHLVKGGNFVTKVFRSGDYNALMWSFQQLFKKVEATKPSSSRNVSAEIFVVCRGYIAPHKIDPRLLDPRHVLEQVQEGEQLTEEQALNQLFHKKKKDQRNRQGYDDATNQAMHTSQSVIDFLQTKEPVKMLAQANEIHFKDKESKAIYDNPNTTHEIKACLEDLKVLGKGELRNLLKWRSQMRELLQKQRQEELEDEEEANDDESGASSSEEEEEDDGDVKDGASESSSDDEELDEELRDLKAQEAKRKKRELKKKRREKIKLQRRIDLGMENDFAIDLGEDRGPFNLRDIGLKTMEELEHVQSGAFIPVQDQQSDDEEESDDESDLSEGEAKRRYLEELEAQAEISHARKKKKDVTTEPLSIRQRRQMAAAEKKAKIKKRTLEDLASQDFQRALEDEQRKALEDGAYEKMLQGNDGDDDDDDDDDDEGEETAEGRKKRKRHLLVSDFDDDEAEKTTDEKRAERWFDQALFQGADESSSEDEQDDEEMDDNSSDDSDMPLPSERTDKAKRHEKRKKLAYRNEQKEKKRKDAQQREMKQFAEDLGPMASSQKKPGQFDTVPGEDDEQQDERKNQDKKSKKKQNNNADEDDSDQERERPAWAKELIRKGMGKLAGNDKPGKGFEIVSSQPQQTYDEDSEDEEEKYNSEDYDLEERAQHLALGSMLTKKSKRRKLLDSAYNRYAFNDENLPDWFVEDENKHNRPQIPITKEMVETIKARFKDLAARPINKVAEARARKKRKLMSKVEKAKKKAAVVAEEPDMSTRAKMRAIEKIYKGATIKKPSSVYVVARKSQHGKVNLGGKMKGKKVKLVDKRMKKDAPRADGKKKRGGGKSKSSQKRRR